MKGEIHVVVQNRRVRFEFDLHRNITVVRGDSATGKTKLVSMIDTYANSGVSSGIDLICPKRCLTINNANWRAVIENTGDCVIFADEDVSAVKTVEFARAIQKTTHYYVFITRENLSNLPYSVEEIYGIHTSGKYADLRRTYNSFYQLYSLDSKEVEQKASRVIVEDSNSGFDFYRGVASEDIQVVSAGGKTKIRNILSDSDDGAGDTLIVADGAAFGSEIGEMMLYIQRHSRVHLYLPESFEWTVLASGLIDGKRVSEILQNPVNYIDSKEYFSWEQFFTRLLIQETKDTYLQYTKRKLNENYLNPKEKTAILHVIRRIEKMLGIPHFNDSVDMNL